MHPIIDAFMQIPKLTSVIFFCFCLLTSLGCAISSADQGNLSTPKEIITAEKTGISADTKSMNPSPKFAISLFKQVAQTSKQNVFLSPVSVEFALAMLYNGAEGQTKNEMTNLLLPRPLPLNLFNQQYSQLIKSLTADPVVKLRIANSVWARQDINFQASFLERVRTVYSALVARRNFSNPQVRDEINQWVSKQTEGKIPKIIDEIKRDDVLFLINAVYFKGAWSKPFDKSLTSNQPFFLTDGKQKPVPMMVQTGDFRYLESDRWQSVSLPYGDGRFSMYVFLPKPNQQLSSLISSLSTENWEQWMRSYQVRQGKVELPKFKLEYGITLNQTLQRLGMQEAFVRNRANFKSLTAAEVFVSMVKHKTFVEVNEEGTEAAGSTAIGISVTSVPLPTDPFTMRVDRPFFTAIRDNQTGAILFMGAIYDVTAQ